MSSAWRVAFTQPLGIVGYSLFLVFGIVAVIARQRGRKDYRWVVTAGFALAALSIVSNLGLAYQREARTSQPAPPAASAPAMQINTIEQQSDVGVAGVQGNVQVENNHAVANSGEQKSAPISKKKRR